jgi:hypothetical protein
MATQIIIPNQSLQNAVGIILPACNQLFGQPNDPRYTEMQLDEESASLLFCAHHEDIEAEFNKLVQEWKSVGRGKSLTSALSMNPAYQKIIGMGQAALPLILRELARELDHWFWALESISRENPVPEESRGNIEEMARIWMQWGRERGYAR